MLPVLLLSVLVGVSESPVIHFAPPSEIAVPERLSLELCVEREGTCTLVEVPFPGSWPVEDLGQGEEATVRVSSQHWWAPILTVPKQGFAVMEVRPAGILMGRVAAPEGSRLPSEMHITLFDPKSWDEKPQWVVECPLRASQFRCKVPVGKFDGRLRVGGFAANYLWGLAVLEGEEKDLGEQHLVPGASLSGWVETGNGIAVDTSTRVALRHSGAVGGLGKDRRLRGEQVTVTERGFFQFKGLRAGSYSLVASQEGMADAHSPEMVVMSGRESILTEPLVLELPCPLQLSISPALDPQNRPWEVSLVHGEHRRAVSGTANSQGEWLSEDLPTGRYRFSILSARGDRWHDDEIEVTPWGEPMEVKIPLVPIHGVVTRDDKPIRAHLWFGGKSGGQRVYLAADSQGHFRGVLPRTGRWRVDAIIADQEDVVLGLEPVIVEPELEPGVAELHLAVPATELSGHVVDPMGRGVAGARVQVEYNHSGEARFSSHFSGDDGSFRFLGLPTGGVRVKATRGEVGTRTVRRDLQEAEPVLDLVLELERHKVIQGRVVSPYGPVPRARLFVQPEAPGADWTPPEVVLATDLEGEFRLQIPDDANAVMVGVLAPGYGARLLTLRAPSSPVEILVGQETGSVRLDLSSADPDRFGGLRLASADGWIPLVLLQHLWAVEREETGMRILHLEPNRYGICLPGRLTTRIPAEQCAWGELAPWGELQLTLPRDPSRPEASTPPPVPD